MINVKDYGAIGDGSDDSLAISNAITQAANNGLTLFFPSGTYGVQTGLIIPGNNPFSIKFDSGALLLALADGITVLSISNDISRTGFRGIENLRIDGNSKKVTGLKIGSTTSACLQVYVDNADIRGCETGIDAYSSMENAFINVVCQNNVVGLKLRQDPVNGGGNANVFSGVKLQSNTIGMILDGKSLPFVNNQFNGLIQSNTLCGIAAFGVDGGFSINNTHFEGNGISGTSLVVDGNTIQRCSIQLDDSIVVINDSKIGEATANPAIKLYNNSLLSINNTGGYGVSEGLFFEDADNTDSKVFLTGNCRIAGSGGYIQDWSGMSISGGRGVVVGSPLLKDTTYPINTYFGNGGVPKTPEAQNVKDATVSKVTTPDMGLVQRVAYINQAGTSQVNRVTFSTHQNPIVAGDKIAVSFFARADKRTEINFNLVGNTQFTGPKAVKLDKEWRRIVIYGSAALASAVGYSMYAYPVDSDAPVIDFSTMMCAKNLFVDEVVRQGLFSQ